MVSLEYSTAITARQVLTYGSVHHCNKCIYSTKSIFFMRNHVRFHQLPPRLFNCEDDIEVFYCKECHFKTHRTSYFNHHIKLRHPGNHRAATLESTRFILKSYECDGCVFQTFSFLLWVKHQTNCPHGPNHANEADDKLDDILVENLKQLLKKKIMMTEMKKFACHQCPYTTKNKSHMVRHKWVHIPWLQCDKCRYRTRMESEFKQHREKHVSKIKAPDKFGGVLVESLEPLVEEKLAKTKMKKFVCHQCSYNTMIKARMIRHKMVHVPWLQCDKCRYRTRVESEFKQHREKHVSKIKAPDKFGGVLVESLEPLVEEKLAKTKKKKFVCHQCSYNTMIKARMIRHQTVHVPWLQCDKCRYRTRVESEFKRHLEKHVSKIKASDKFGGVLVESLEPLVEEKLAKIKKKKFVCHQCSYNTMIKARMIRHQTVHVAWLKCDKCRYKTRVETKLKVHLKRHLSKTKAQDKIERVPVESLKQVLQKKLTKTKKKKKFVCHQCRYTTKDKSHMVRHQMVHLPWLKCDKCRYKTRAEPEFTLHLEQHLPEAIARDKIEDAVVENLQPLVKKKVAKTKKKKFACHQCPYKTIIEGHMIRHQTVHVPWLQCDKCRYKTRVETELKLHLEQHLSETTAHAEIESVVENSKKQLAKTKKKKFACSQCRYTTNNRHHIARHQLVHLPWLECDKCGYRTRVEAEFKVHLETHVLKGFKCPECEVTTKYRHLLDTHISHRHKSVVKGFKCPECEVTTKYQHLLDTHISHRHKSVAKGFKCPECEVTTKYRHLLDTHIFHRHKKAQKKTDNSRFRCTKCSYTSMYEYSLKRHCLTRHPQLKKHWLRCPQCNYKTIHQRLLDVHNLHSHKKEDTTTENVQTLEIQNVFSCEKCIFQTSTMDALENHIAKVHTVTCPPVLESPGFKCHECDYASRVEIDVQIHTKQEHSGPLSTKCDICLYEFSTKHALIRHMKEQHGSEQLAWFVCKTCPYKAKRKASLLCHLAAVHH